MNENQLKTKNYYSLEEVRGYVYAGLVSKGTILNMVGKGEIPIVKVMSRSLVPAWWVNKQIALATTEPGVANG